MKYVIEPITALKDNYIWIMHSTEKKSLIVDPGEAPPVIDYLEKHQLKLNAILITHHHWDHTNGLQALSELYSPSVYGFADSTVRGLTQYVRENDTVNLAGFPDFKVIEIPGHTLDHIAYYTKGSLFCGDTLFSAGCGRAFEGTAEQLYHALEKIGALPPHTQVYCAHEYTLNNLLFAQMVEPSNQIIQQRILQVKSLREKNLPSLPSTLAIEKASNPFLRCDLPEVIYQVEQHTGHRLNHIVEVFSALREWKNQW